MFPQLYHAHHSLNLEDLPFWLGLAATAGDPILELGCGTGRVLLPLALAGYHTIGLDNNPSTLKFLKANIRSPMEPVPLLIEADMRGFNLAMQFSLIILPCNTFSTLQKNDRQASLECIHKHLRPGGLFAVCLPNPELLMRLPVRSAAEFEDEFIHPQTGDPVQVSSSWRRMRHSFCVTWFYDHLHSDGTVERLVVETNHQLIPVDTYKDEIQRVGLKVTEMYGDFNHAVYTADSPYLIILATG